MEGLYTYQCRLMCRLVWPNEEIGKIHPLIRDSYSDVFSLGCNQYKAVDDVIELTLKRIRTNDSITYIKLCMLLTYLDDPMQSYIATVQGTDIEAAFAEVKAKILAQSGG